MLMVFIELFWLFEWVGLGKFGIGLIIGLFMVFVEGDNYNELVVDVVCGIFDGYVVMEWVIVECGCYLVINVFKFVFCIMLCCVFLEYVLVFCKVK